MTAFGTATFGGPDEIVTTTVEPCCAVVPPVGFVEITVFLGTVDQATLLLQQRMFVVATKKVVSTSQAPGTVLSQHPASGKAPQGSTVTLTVAEAPPNVSVPRLVGRTEAAASALLGKLGLTPAPVTEVKNRNPSYDGLVLSQSPSAHTSVPPGTSVTINVERYVPPAGPTGPSLTGPTGVSGPTGTT